MKIIFDNNDLNITKTMSENYSCFDLLKAMYDMFYLLYDKQTVTKSHERINLEFVAKSKSKSENESNVESKTKPKSKSKTASSKATSSESTSTQTETKLAA